jgi:predicted nucleic acid-binding protein
MVHLLHSSAIILTLKRLRENSVDLLDGEATLNLAYYEIGNVIWKECTLEGSIEPLEAINRFREVAQILEIMKIEEIKSDEELGEIMKIAIEQKLTFYDASYLQVAKNKRCTLVTGDGKLLERSENMGVKAITVNKFLKSVSPSCYANNPLIKTITPT